MSGGELVKDLEGRGITVAATAMKLLAEEAPYAYKDVSEVFGELTVDVTTDCVVAQARIDDETRNRSGSTGRLGALCLCPREGGESRAECSDNGDACHGSGERSEDDVYDSLFAGAFYDAARAFARCPCHSRYADGIPRVSQ